MNSTASRSFHCLKCVLKRSESFRKIKSNFNGHHVRYFGANITKNEWIEPVGNRTGVLIYNSLTKRKDELILPKGNTLSW